MKPNRLQSPYKGIPRSVLKVIRSSNLTIRGIGDNPNDTPEELTRQQMASFAKLLLSSGKKPKEAIDELNRIYSQDSSLRTPEGGNYQERR